MNGSMPKPKYENIERHADCGDIDIFAIRQPAACMRGW